MKYIILAALILSGCASQQPLVIQSFDSYKWNKISTASANGSYKKFDTVEAVNRYVNKYPYRSEKTDDWKTPARFFKEGGDCEDYAIAKYYLIKKNGLDDGKDMNVVLVYDTVMYIHHAVLMVGDDVLDNQTDEILKATKLKSRYIFLGKVKP